MSYRLEFSGRAKKDVELLDRVTQKRIAKKLQFYLSLDDPLQPATKLTNFRDGTYRWHIGHYRVVFDVEGKTIVVLRIQHRSQVYS